VLARVWLPEVALASRVDEGPVLADRCSRPQVSPNVAATQLAQDVQSPTKAVCGTEINNLKTELGTCGANWQANSPRRFIQGGRYAAAPARPRHH